MNTEFHYYVNKGIALRAGFSEADAERIAYSAQFVDDNMRLLTINAGKPDEFSSFISQTYNILKPRKTLSHIYTLFHFIPGKPEAQAAYFRRRAYPVWSTTPDSENARAILQQALVSGDRYRIGIASHAFADTWAHQNFIGLFDESNSMPGPINALIPNVGHADAGNAPDYVSFIWNDSRLLQGFQKIENNPRFLGAAQRLFEEYALFLGKGTNWIRKEWEGLAKDILKAFGETDTLQIHENERKARYRSLLSVQTDYDRKAWFDNAIQSYRGALRFRKGYEQSDWFCFQKAVKVYQDETWILLRGFFEKVTNDASFLTILKRAGKKLIFFPSFPEHFFRR
jgi:hypothetical protein